METTLTIQISKSQIVSSLRKLNFNDRISILKEFSDDWLNNILALKEPKPLTTEKYNAKLKEGEDDFEKGNVITHSDLLKEAEKWKKRKH